MNQVINLLIWLIAFFLFSREHYFPALGFGILGILGIVVSITRFNKNKSLKNQIKEDVFDIKVPGQTKIYRSRKKYLLNSLRVAVFLAVFILIPGSQNFDVFLITIFAAFVLYQIITKLDNEYISFSSEGFTLGDRNFSFIVNWDNISEVDLGSMYNIQCVLINLLDTNLLMESIKLNQNFSKDKAEKMIQKNIDVSRGWIGWDLAIVSEKFSLSPVYFVRLIEKYRSHPDSRKDLQAEDSVSEINNLEKTGS